MAYNRKTLAENNGLSVWLKHKIIKKKNGEEKEVFQSSVDIGGGKMIKITVDARLYTVEKENDTLLPVYVSKWKAEPKTQNKNKSW